MAIIEHLNLDMKQAMRDKAKLKLGVIRMVKASMQNEAIKLQKDALTEEEELTVLAKELKQRKDSLHEFKEAGRDDLVNKLVDEIEIVQAYMPKQLSDEALEQIIVQTINEVHAESKQDMGKVMSAIMPKVKGQADGSRVNKLVLKNLS